MSDETHGDAVEPTSAAPSESDDEIDDEVEAPPVPSPPAPPPPPRGKPRAGLLANLAAFALIPLVALVGALAPPDRPELHSRHDDLFVGLFVAGLAALLTAPLARLAHRWAVEWLALAAAGSLWLFGSTIEDTGSHPPPGNFESLGLYHQLSIREGLESANLLESSGGVLLGGCALVLALLLTSRHDAAQRPLSRAWLLLSLLPLAALALVVGVTASMSSFVLASIVLASLALARVASRVNLGDRRSVGLALASVFAASAAVASAAAGASTHGLVHVLYATTGPHLDVQHVGEALVRRSWLAAGAGTTVLAVLPPLAFAAALDVRGIGWPALPRVSAVLSTLVFVAMLWLDGRNRIDIQHHVAAYLQVTGLTDVAALADFRLARVDPEEHVQDGFVMVPLHGGAHYRGATLLAGPGGVASLVHDREVPPIALDVRAHASDVFALLAPLRARRVRAVRLVGESVYGDGLATVHLGPLIRELPRSPMGYETIWLFLVVEPTSCFLASSAGERIEMPDCREVLRTRLEERRAAEPNRRDVIIAPTDDVPLQWLLDVLAIVEQTGYDERPLMRPP